jgi:hypothetical protein
VTPEALMALLQDDGSVRQDRAIPTPEGGLGVLSLQSIDQAWDVFANAETRGFRAVSFAVPPGRPADDRFRLQFRLSGTTWRVVGLEMPKAIEARLVQELIKRNPTAS